MFTIEIREPGDPEVLVPVERPQPAPASGELLIKVAAAGVNRPSRGQRPAAPPGPASLRWLAALASITFFAGGTQKSRRASALSPAY